MDWKVFGSKLKDAASKGMTAEEFAAILGTDVEKTRQQYQSFKIKVKAAIRKQVETRVEGGEVLEKPVDAVVEENFERIIKDYTLKGGRGRRSDDLGLDIEISL